MKRNLFLAAALCAAAACSPDATDPLRPTDPALAKASTQNTDTDSRAILQFSDLMPDGTAAGIRGDGAGAYEGNVCGVHAKIFWNDPDYSQSGDLVFDPDANKSGSCAARKLLFDLDSDPATAATVLGPFTNVRQIMQVTATRTQVMQWSVALPDCERIRFGTAGSDNLTATSGGVLVERLASSPGQWRVTTVDGVGKCYNWRKGSYSHIAGVDPVYTLPYQFTATEKPYGS